MSLAGKAIWMIERNLGNELSLSDVAYGCGVSKFHLARAFEARVGMPVMQYVRARRLSQAAVTLAQGAMDILNVALDTGYASHEAFTRAFKAQFGITPETVRKQRSTEDLDMVKPVNIPDATSSPGSVEHRIEKLGAFVVVGMARRQTLSETLALPGQWQEFMSLYDQVSHKANPIPLSVTTDMDSEGNFIYLTGIEVSSGSDVPKGLVARNVPAQTYAVFAHRSHVSEIGKTFAAIWDRWVPQSGKVISDGPFLEKHLPTFNPRTGLGGIDIYIPVV